MKICENCPFKEQAELYCDGEEMMKICKYQSMCERVLEQCIIRIKQRRKSVENVQYHINPIRKYRVGFFFK